MGWLLPDNRELSVGIHLDDAARLMLFATLPAILHHIVNGILDFLADFVESLRCRFSADVGTRAHDGLLESEAEFIDELFLCDADAGTAVFGYHVGSQPGHMVEDDRERLVAQLYHVPSDIGHVPHIALQTHIAIDQTDECLAVLAFLDFKHLSHGFLVGGIAADAPHRVGRVEDDNSRLQHFNEFL